ncbi:response regulator transcription factor [Anaeromyxobacter diazotrophicus]|uniref:Phosphate regulon transcriptional regulatory protein PhoB n=1 Tax=Anaeromyxobacter diazotrophicus TaxID=2590199 RepID=A0A7I9VPX9_9BACT|nr:response regulator transcription factor [Anaeromyxobacter diazotrophicus]GEJ58463.1 DNA-binding response regulator [Anaeromyxobacter diazotrophicus]
MKGKILVIEDDPSILRGLQLNLSMEGYAVRSAMDGETGLALAKSESPDLLLVDVMLPKMGGLDVIRALRESDRETPILILSAKGQEADKVTGLQLGADDYVVKPFSLKELLARIAAALRRRGPREPEEAGPRRFGEVEVDLVARRLTVRGEPVGLTAREFDLLAFFVAHPGRVYSREQLMQAVWGARYSGTARTVDNFVGRLRAHLGDDAEHPRHLETVRGYGYRFTP